MLIPKPKLRITFFSKNPLILLKSGQQQDFKSTLVTFVYLRFEFESKEVIKKDYYVIKPIKPKLVINNSIIPRVSHLKTSSVLALKMHRLSSALLRSSQSKGVSASSLLSKQQQQSHNSSQNNVFSTTQPACTLVSAVTSDSRLFQQPVCSLPLGSNHTNQGALVTSFRNYSDGRRPGFFQNVLQNLKQEAEKNKDMQACF